MLFGVCNEMFEGWALEDVFQKAAEIGYDGVEIAPFTLSDRPVEMGQACREQVRQLAAAAGVQVIGLHWLLARTDGYHLTSPERPVREATSFYLSRLVDLAADFGGSTLVFGSPQQRSLLPGVSASDARRYAIEALKPVAARAEERKVTFCIEPLGPEETNFINTADEAWALAQDIGSPNVKVILDVKAMSTERQEVGEVIRSHAAHAGHVHANDPNRRGPGFGETDFRPIMQALQESGYNGYVSVEVFDFSPDPVTIAARSLEYMREALQN